MCSKVKGQHKACSKTPENESILYFVDLENSISHVVRIGSTTWLTCSTRAGSLLIVPGAVRIRTDDPSDT